MPSAEVVRMQGMAATLIRAAKVLEEKNQRAVAQMLNCLAAEIALKSALQHFKGRYPKGHTLKDLYKELPEHAKVVVAEKFGRAVEQHGAPVQGTREGMEWMLEQASNDFVDIRYFHESGLEGRAVVNVVPALEALWNGLGVYLSDYGFRPVVMYPRGPDDSDREG